MPIRKSFLYSSHFIAPVVTFQTLKVHLDYSSNNIQCSQKEWALRGSQMATAAMKLKDTYDQPRQHIKKQRHYFANKGLSGQAYGFSSGHVWM